MERLFGNGLYEVTYGEVLYEHLQYIRVDRICDETYVTLKNVLTEEILTFELKRIDRIRKRNEDEVLHFPQVDKFAAAALDNSTAMVAKEHSHSLY
jgi:hypothetical protein